MILASLVSGYVLSQVGAFPVLIKVPSSVLQEDLFQKLAMWPTTANIRNVEAAFRKENVNEEREGFTVLAFAVFSHYPISTLRLALQLGARLNHVGVFGVTSLLVAVDSNQHSTVKFLLESGADPEAGRWDGKSCLMLAAEQGEEQIVKELLRHGARASTGCIDTEEMTDRRSDGWTALHFAVFGASRAVEGSVGCIRVLAAQSGLREIVDMRGQTPTMLARTIISTRTDRLGLVRKALPYLSSK